MNIRQARREFKFHLKGERADAVLADIKEILPRDKNGASGAYPIVSEYYDTLERDAYWERNRKLGNRRKLRVRIYGTSNGTIAPSAFFEVKHKCDGFGVKRRMTVPLDTVMTENFDVVALIRELYPSLKKRADQTLAEEILRLVDQHKVAPTMQMRYDRLAFEGADGVRITFDSGIKCRSERLALEPDDPRFSNVVLPPGDKILEVKLFAAAPYWLRDLTAKHRFTKTPFSKYCEALAAFDPVIHPILNRSRRQTA